RPEPSCRPRSEYSLDVPFERETQYQKDFRAWPLPRRVDHPWIPKPCIPAASQAAAPVLGTPKRRPPSQERWPVQVAAEAPGGAGVLGAGEAMRSDERYTRKKAGPAWMLRRAEGLGPEQTPLPAAQAQAQVAGPEGGKPSSPRQRDTIGKIGPRLLATKPTGSEIKHIPPCLSPRTQFMLPAAGSISRASARDLPRKAGPGLFLALGTESSHLYPLPPLLPEPNTVGLNQGLATGLKQKTTTRSAGTLWLLKPAAQVHSSTAKPPVETMLQNGIRLYSRKSVAFQRQSGRKVSPAACARRTRGQRERAAAPALCRRGPIAIHSQAHEDSLHAHIPTHVPVVISTSRAMNEFRAWTDIKPVKPIKAKLQYKPPDDKMAHETSYSAQFKGEANKPTPADNKFIERRRIRSLYSEPFKECPKVEKTSVQSSKPKKTSASHKAPRKAKDKQVVSGRAFKKKSAEGPSAAQAQPDDKEQSKEMNNKLAEAKESQVHPTSDSHKNRGPVATEPDKKQGPDQAPGVPGPLKDQAPGVPGPLKDQAPGVPGPLKDQAPGVPGPLKDQAPGVPGPLKDQAPGVPGPLKDKGSIVTTAVKNQDHTVPGPLKNEGSGISAPVKDQGSLFPLSLNNQRVPARVKDQGSMVLETPKDPGPVAPAPVKDQGPMVPEHLKDRSAMLIAPVKKEGPMLSEPAKNQGSVVPEPVKGQGGVAPELLKGHDSVVVKNQGSMVPERVKDRGTVIPEPPKNQGPVVLEPVKNPVPIISVPLKDQDPLVPPPAKDQGPVVPGPLKTQGPRGPQLSTVSPPPPVTIPTVPHAEYIESSP
uniref:Microtubule associated protein 6 n=1 Tax=Myotis lucifugus TaxID=59463 RepID=G1P1P6_MYOLU